MAVSKKVATRLGRPVVYKKGARRRIALALDRNGSLLGAQKDLANRGFEVSITTIRSVADEKGLTFKRGRPRTKNVA